MTNNSRFNVLRLNVIAERGLQEMRKHDCEVAEECADPDAIILRSHKLEMAEIAPSVLAVARAGAGVNNISIGECTARGIPVFNTPGGNANAVKELVMAGMLLASRGIHQGIRYVESLGEITDNAELSRQLEAEKKRFKGMDLAGHSLGIIGLGAIGARVARHGFDHGYESFWLRSGPVARERLATVESSQALRYAGVSDAPIGLCQRACARS